MHPIYLDYNATSPLDPRVLEAMSPHWITGGNPESQHTAGRSARRAWNNAKAIVAQVLGASESEVIFTSGGTESNNLALHSLAHAQRHLCHIVASPLEHPAVREPLAELGKQGFEIEMTSVRQDGLVEIDDMKQRLQAQTAFASLMLAHNETGAIQPVARIAELAMERGIPTHTDAVQAVGRIPVDFHKLGAATLAASAHKLHGPIGIGVLLLKKAWKCHPLMFGGHQQSKCRPGTPPVALAVGMATALKLWQEEASERIKSWRELRTRFTQQLTSALGPERVKCNGPADPSLQLPQTINVAFPRVDGDLLLIQLDLAGICASLGAACESGSTQPSPSLIAMQVPTDCIRSSVRFSMGALTTSQEIDEAIKRIIDVINSIGPRFPNMD